MIRAARLLRGAVGLAILTSLLVRPAVAATTVAAGPSTFEGVVGKSKVVMLIDTKTWKGTYFYRSIGRDIALSGSPGRLNEVDPNFFTNASGDVTAVFEGKLSADRTTYAGMWTSKVNASKLPFSLTRTGNGTPGVNTKVTVKAKVTTVTPKNSLFGDATYRLPQVTGVTPEWIGTRITGKASALAFYELTLQQVIADFTPNGLGVTSVDYKVPYNGDGILNLTMLTETSQAYPDHFEHYAVFDLRNGARMGADDLWATSTKSKLIALLQKQLNDNINDQLNDPDTDLTADMLRDNGNARVNDDTLSSVTIEKQGVRLTHQFNFPHAIEAAEPSGVLLLTWAEVKAFRNPNTPFANVR
jgi:hypothetical protein